MVPRDVKWCLEMSRGAQRCQEVPRDVKRCLEMSRGASTGVKKYLEVPRDEKRRPGVSGAVFN